MFAKTIIDSDSFLDMPVGARLLYYDLAMRADDDGFVNSPKKIMKCVDATSDDMDTLISQDFVMRFDSGIVVIRHWRVHNYIRKDTYKETRYRGEKAMLELDENNTYKLKDEFRRRSVDEPSTQDRIGKVRIGKDRISGGGDDARARAQTHEEENKDLPDDENLSWTEQTKRVIFSLDDETKSRLLTTVDALTKAYWEQNGAGDYDICTCYDIIENFHKRRSKKAAEFTFGEDDTELLSEAFRLSADAKKQNWNYIRGVFRKFKERGIRCTDDYWEYEFKRSERKS